MGRYGRWVGAVQVAALVDEGDQPLVEAGGQLACGGDGGEQLGQEGGQGVPEPAVHLGGQAVVARGRARSGGLECLPHFQHRHGGDVQGRGLLRGELGAGGQRRQHLLLGTRHHLGLRRDFGVVACSQLGTGGAACGQQAGRAAQRRHLPGVVRGLQSAGEGWRRPLTQVQPGMPLPQGLSSISRSLRLRQLRPGCRHGTQRLAAPSLHQPVHPLQHRRGVPHGGRRAPAGRMQLTALGGEVALEARPPDQ